MPPPIDLAAVLAELEQAPYATASGTIDDVQRALQHEERMGRLPNAKGQVRRVLKPFAVTEAPSRSLSALVGTGAQPLHSDGAHLPDPPDVLVLHCATTSETPTVVWPPADLIEAPYPRSLSGRVWAKLPETVGAGLFNVRANGRWFLAHSWDGRFRYDPGCMSPADRNARDAAEFFDDARSQAFVHEWSTPNKLLFIDNRYALHARDAVAEGDDRTVERLTFSWGMP